jgi:hypothetical protein
MRTKERSDAKRFQQLWWKFLQESDRYRIFCESLVGHADYMTAFLKKMSPFVEKAKTNISATALVVSEVWLLMTYKRFGNVFQSEFDDWWNAQDSSMSPDHVAEDLEETIEREACNFVGYCACCLKALISDDTIIDLLQRYIKFNTQEYKFIKVRISASDREIRDAVSNLISQHKKKHTPSLDLLESYLTTYKLFKAGHDEKVILKKILGARELSHLTKKQAHDKISLYRLKAENIIFNVEKGYFPGQF